MEMTFTEFLEVLSIGTMFGFGFCSLFGLLGYSIQSIKRVIFTD